MPWFRYSGAPAHVPTEWNVAPPLPSAVHERLESLYAWEGRLRGYPLFPQPVALEPAFASFDADVPAQDWETMAQPRHLDVGRAFLPFLLPQEQAVTPAQMAGFLGALRTLRYPLSLEIIGGAEGVTYQVACSTPEVEAVAALARGQFPLARIEAGDDALAAAIIPLTRGAAGFLVVDFGLYHAVYRSLKVPNSFGVDSLGALTGALACLEAGEMGGIQLLLSPVREPWDNELEMLVAQFASLTASHPNARDSEAERAVRFKLATPLWAVALRVFAVTQRGPADGFGARALELCQVIGGTLDFAGERQANGLAGNSLLALDDAGYKAFDHLKDVLDRRSRRTGMLLSQVEVAAL